MTERTRVLGLAGLIVVTIVVYAIVRAAGGGAANDERRLLPYQTLARTLPATDQQMFDELHKAILVAERLRAASRRWPDPATVGAEGDGAFASPRFEWQQRRQGMITDYLAVPHDPGDAAWLVKLQEPEPGALPDQAPNDEEHHRLSDGTVLHLYIWMHRLGGHVPREFAPSPESSGWTQILYEPPNPILPPRT